MECKNWIQYKGLCTIGIGAWDSRTTLCTIHNPGSDRFITMQNYIGRMWFKKCIKLRNWKSWNGTKCHARTRCKITVMTRHPIVAKHQLFKSPKCKYREAFGNIILICVLLISDLTKTIQICTFMSNSVVADANINTTKSCSRTSKLHFSNQ